MATPDEGTSTAATSRDRWFTVLVLVVAGALMVAAGVWGLVAPRSFAAFAGFPYSRHFLHDAGAFQLGIGVTLLLAAAWADAAAVVLAGFLVTNTVHTVNHVVDLDAGGHAWDAWGLGVLSVLVLAALVVRMRRLGWVAGEVATCAAVPELARFTRQKTILLTSYRRDGTPVGAPVSIVVDGDHAFVRSPGNGGKVKRIRRNPIVQIAPSTAWGRPTGPALQMRAHLVQGEEFRRAGRLLARKYPMLQGAFVPLAHRLGRVRPDRPHATDGRGRSAGRGDDPHRVRHAGGPIVPRTGQAGDRGHVRGMSAMPAASPTSMATCTQMSGAGSRRSTAIVRPNRVPITAMA
jgi:PPOX class probable F420-dependent enzyme